MKLILRNISDLWKKTRTDTLTRIKKSVFASVLFYSPVNLTMTLKSNRSTISRDKSSIKVLLLNNFNMKKHIPTPGKGRLKTITGLCHENKKVCKEHNWFPVLHG